MLIQREHFWRTTWIFQLLCLVWNGNEHCSLLPSRETPKSLRWYQCRDSQPQDSRSAQTEYPCHHKGILQNASDTATTNSKGLFRMNESRGVYHHGSRTLNCRSQCWILLYCHAFLRLTKLLTITLAYGIRRYVIESCGSWIVACAHLHTSFLSKRNMSLLYKATCVKTHSKACVRLSDGPNLLVAAGSGGLSTTAINNSLLRL
jgi:hypothetical protein